jgi:primosomal protein N' (replication factor Y)
LVSEQPPAVPRPPVAEACRVRVIVDTPQHSGLSGPLDYLSPHPLEAGTLVRVPLGRREVLGIVWDGGGEPGAGGEAPTPESLRAVIEVLDALPPVPRGWRELVDFAASYYQRGLGEVALAALAPELRQINGTQLARRLKRLRSRLSPGAEVPAAAERPVPSEDQREVLQALSQSAPRVHLLHGLTGSGKTEVYLRESQRMLDAGRQALVLVPEINLTPQLEARFLERFPGRRVVSLHSGLTPALRLRHWLMALLGEADLVLGTRMAVFAPMPRLGLIVVDEEHDPSYKQQEGARYSARDLAVMRSRIEQIPVLLGSATPSLETWHNALPAAEGGAGRYSRLTLAHRIGGGALPAVRVVDMNRFPAKLLREQPVAPPLMDALRERLARGEQSLVFLNRRGYAPVLQCLECGWKSGCPNCSAWRVFHKQDRSLRCHHCGYTQTVPRACPECGNADIQPVGRGTERLEEQLAQSLLRADGSPARVGRIDADTTRERGKLEATLASVHAGDVDVLVGTQMVAKGHDFRRITLVAAVNSDSALFSSDFRAAERLYALLMQAAGRAGRDARHAGQSEMWVQTWSPQHSLYASLQRHDFPGFARGQLDERRIAGLPPFAHLALVRADARTQDAAQQWLAQASAWGSDLAASLGVVIYPAVPTPIQRVANVERAQMLVESASRPALQRFLAQWMPGLHALRTPRVLRWAVDVDPLAI